MAETGVSAAPSVTQAALGGTVFGRVQGSNMKSQG